MLFVKRSTTAIWIPRHCDAVGPYRLLFVHNMTNAEHSFNDLTNEGYKSGYWIFMNLDLRELESGEHTYKVFDVNNNEIETGLVQVMYQLSEPISYNTEKTIVQYGD